MLKKGRKAPAFTLKDQTGTERSLKEFAGTWVLIYFYPKDDTPGCTKEACAIAEVYKDFKRLGVTVLGVSKDSVRSHQKFATKYSLPFILLSDPDTEMIQAYDAWVEKSMYGKKYMGTARVSYLCSPDGKIIATYPDVDPANHALEILKDVKVLKKQMNASST
jgi:thioredoxin-dependent peroxiredoxin